ncbi:hypothetical protein ANCCAN_16560 [Ancylostoma caninum]|uniref:Uncharacterized protein n=1 Tax=Ancylostoma caninum TaxID=29170 RepID=A0A368G4G7_ANCCA|nr:hypothetical protein ANCCAN_16560 [Ancylostoma caninum]
MPIVMPIFFCLVCTTLVVVTIIDDISSAAVGLGIWAGGFIIYMLLIFDRALPSSSTYRRITHRINNNTTEWAQIIFDVMPEQGDDSEREYAIGGSPHKVFAIDAKSEALSDFIFASLEEDLVKTRL